jgi:hypothetical protein
MKGFSNIEGQAIPLGLIQGQKAEFQKQRDLTTIALASDLSASVASGNIWRLTVNTMAAASGTLDPDAVRAFSVSSSNNGNLTTIIAPQNVLSNYTTLSTDGTTLTFYLTGSNLDGPGTYSNITLFYNKKTTDQFRGDFEQGQLYATGSEVGFDGTNIAIPEINISMQSQAITAKTKKLKAAWTPEFAQDLNAYQNLDAEAELTNIMSEYISLEIDLEILDMLIEDVPASNIEYWSAVNNVVATSTVAPTASLGFFNTQGAWFQTLGTKINKLSNKIHQLTLRGGANFMVVSPTVSTILESIPGFAANSSGTEDMEYAFGVQKAGAFNSRYTVYKNPYMTENTILVGFRGKQFLEAGAVFAPYIPLIMTPLIYDPVNFTPRKGLLTRFAKKMLRPEFYGKIYIAGLNTL